MTAAEELAAVRAEINRQYWIFTRSAKGRPVDPALRRREAELERQLKSEVS